MRSTWLSIGCLACATILGANNPVRPVEKPPTPVRVQAVKAQLATAQATWQQAKANLAKAQAVLTKAQLDFERATNLLATQSMTKADYDGYNENLGASQ